MSPRHLSSLIQLQVMSNLSRKRRPSLADIADVAGVHKMTVSRALRDSDRVTAETRERIKKIAIEMGYNHSSLVSTVMGQLARGRYVDHPTPIMLLLDFKVPPHKLQGPGQQVVDGALKTATSLGFSLDVAWRHEPGMTDHRLNTILEARNIQGLVVNVVSGPNQTLDLDWSRLVGVTCGARLARPRLLPHVQSDVVQYTRRALQELTARGYERIGFTYHAPSAEILENVQIAVVLEYQRSLAASRVVPLLDITEKGERKIISWYRKHRPDAIFGAFPMVADWLQDEGIRVPEDVGLACHLIGQRDDHISGISQNKGELTSAAVEIVVSNLVNGRFGEHDLPKRTLVGGEWVEGNTLRPRAR